MKSGLYFTALVNRWCYQRWLELIDRSNAVFKIWIAPLKCLLWLKLDVISFLLISQMIEVLPTLADPIYVANRMSCFHFLKQVHLVSTEINGEFQLSLTFDPTSEKVVHFNTVSHDTGYANLIVVFRAEDENVLWISSLNNNYKIA